MRDPHDFHPPRRTKQRRRSANREISHRKNISGSFVCGFLKKKPSAHDRYKATIRERKMDVQRKMLVFLSGLAV